MAGKNSGTILGSLLTLTGFGAPVGVGLIAADQAGAFDPPELPKPKDPTVAEDREGALAAERERRRISQTQTNKAGSAAQALTAAIGKTQLGGTS